MAMKTICLTSWVLFTCLGVPFHTSAQSEQPGYQVSVRELTIPRKALHEFQEGVDLLAKKDPAGSLPHFQRAILEYAGYYEAYDRIGAAELKLWRIPEAEQAFRKSVEVSAGQYAHPLLALGAILDGRKEFSEADSVLRRGLNLAPTSWQGHYYLALALFGLNRLADAEESVRESLRRKMDFPQAYLLLADIHRRTEDYHSLISDVNEYLRIAPDGPAGNEVRALRESAERMILGPQTAATSAEAQP